MNINELTIGDLKQLNSLLAGNTTSSNVDMGKWEIGKIYLVMTVTHYFAGILEDVNHHEVTLKDATWVADTGRFSDALLDQSVVKELELLPDGFAIIGRGSIILAVQPKWSMVERAKR